MTHCDHRCILLNQRKSYDFRQVLADLWSSLFELNLPFSFIFPLLQILLQTRNPRTSRWTPTRLQVWKECKRMEGVREMTVSLIYVPFDVVCKCYVFCSFFDCFWRVRWTIYTLIIVCLPQCCFLPPFNLSLCCDIALWCASLCLIKNMFIIPAWQS